jgi:hypothetical protein
MDVNGLEYKLRPFLLYTNQNKNKKMEITLLTPPCIAIDENLLQTYLPYFFFIFSPAVSSNFPSYSIRRISTHWRHLYAHTAHALCWFPIADRVVTPLKTLETDMVQGGISNDFYLIFFINFSATFSMGSPRYHADIWTNSGETAQQIDIKTNQFSRGLGMSLDKITRI